MARVPRSPDAKPRRDEILDCATRLFAERGYEGASMADLAESVGMRKASLFYHFPSKDVLYAAVLDRLVAAVAAAIGSAATADGSYAERLDTLSDAITNVLGAQPFAARLIVREAMDWGPVIRDTLGEPIMNVLAVAQQFIEAGQKDEVFAPGDARQLIISIVGVHFMPFAIGGIVERYIGLVPFEPTFIERRREAVREQVRALVLLRRKR